MNIDKLSTDGASKKLLAVPATVSRCDDGSRPLDTPAGVTGRDLSSYLLFGLYADPGWSFSACWGNARWSELRTAVVSSRLVTQHEPDGTIVRVKIYTIGRRADVLSDHQEYVTVPGRNGAARKILGRTVMSGTTRRWTCVPGRRRTITTPPFRRRATRT